MSGKTSQRRPVLLLLLVIGGACFGSWKWWEFHHHRQTMAEIESEIVSGMHGIAGAEADVDLGEASKFG